MAGEFASFFVRLGTIFDDKGLADAKKAINETLDPINAMKDVLGELGLTVGAGAAIWGLVEFGKESLVQFGLLEQSSVSLAMAMKNLGVYTEESFARAQEFAQQMQKQSSFDELEIRNMEALLTTFGLYGNKLEEVAKGAMNLSVARHIDLHTAASLLGKAFEGNTTTLHRFGIQINETGSVAGNFEQVMKQLNERFGGAAESQANTYNGRLATMVHNFDDLKMKIGAELLPVANAWIDWTNRAIAAGDRLVGMDGDNLKGRQLTIAALKEEQQQLGAGLASLATHAGAEAANSKAYQDLKEQIDKVNAAIVRETALLNAQPKEKVGKPNFTPPDQNAAQKKAHDAMLADETAYDAEYKTHLQKEFEAFSETQQEKVNFEAMSLANRLEMEGRHADAVAVMNAHEIKVDKLKGEVLKQNASEVFGFIATMSSAKNKEMMVIGKAGAIAQATINTYVAATAALKMGPIIGPPLAAMVYAAGMAQVANIVGIQLAEGGIVKATPGGVQATIGEGGQDEVVAPLNKLKSMLGINGGGAGGGAHVTVHQNINFEGGFGGFGAGGGDPAGIAEIMDQMRIATRDGVAEAIDAVKQFKNTADARAGEA